jgi:ketosteroid isomerase-like protein
MTSLGSDLQRRLRRHLDAFNRGVRTGDFSTMFAMYHRDAVFVLSDPVWIVHQGIEAIRRAYRGDPPRGTMRLGASQVHGQSVTADYIWDAEPDRIAGQLTLEFADGQVIRELVTFADD